MKRALLFVTLICGLAACKKAGVTPGLIGKWELHRRYGGNIIPADTTYMAGNGNILQFNVDSTYKRYTNGMLTQSGIFHIIKRYSFDNLPNEELYFDSDTSFKSFITISGTILTFQPLVPDIGTTQYDKISN